MRRFSSSDIKFIKEIIKKHEEKKAFLRFVSQKSFKFCLIISILLVIYMVDNPDFYLIKPILNMIKSLLF